MASGSRTARQPQAENTGMDERSDDIRNQPGQVEGRHDLGRGQGYELQAPDGERRTGMVWQTTRQLNETFQVDGPDGFWTERYIDGSVRGPGWSSEERSRHQTGRKRGKYKTKGEVAHNAHPVLGYPSVSACAKAFGVSRKTILKYL